jgi:hypothetical protein
MTVNGVQCLVQDWRRWLAGDIEGVEHTVEVQRTAFMKPLLAA